jgi:hypothetical protein
LNKFIALLVFVFGIAAILGAGWLAFNLPIPR